VAQAFSLAGSKFCVVQARLKARPHTGAFNINVIVVPEQIAVNRAHEAFNADGILKDAKRQMKIEFQPK
jgi:hypothetical protein